MHELGLSETELDLAARAMGTSKKQLLYTYDVTAVSRTMQLVVERTLERASAVAPPESVAEMVDAEAYARALQEAEAVVRRAAQEPDAGGAEARGGMPQAAAAAAAAEPPRPPPAATPPPRPTLRTLLGMGPSPVAPGFPSSPLGVRGGVSKVSAAAAVRTAPLQLHQALAAAASGGAAAGSGFSAAAAAPPPPAPQPQPQPPAQTGASRRRFWTHHETTGLTSAYTRMRRTHTSGGYREMRRLGMEESWLHPERSAEDIRYKIKNLVKAGLLQPLGEDVSLYAGLLQPHAAGAAAAAAGPGRAGAGWGIPASDDEAEG